MKEDNGWPNVEGRVVLGVGEPAPIGIGLLTPRPLEVAVSGGGRSKLRRTAPPRRPSATRGASDVWASPSTLKATSNGLVGFKGEAYTGQGLGQMTGGILQSLDAVTWKATAHGEAGVEGSSTRSQTCTVTPGCLLTMSMMDDLSATPEKPLRAHLQPRYLEQCALGCDKELPHRVRGDRSSNPGTEGTTTRPTHGLASTPSSHGHFRTSPKAQPGNLRSDSVTAGRRYADAGKSGVSVIASRRVLFTARQRATTVCETPRRWRGLPRGEIRDSREPLVRDGAGFPAQAPALGAHTREAQLEHVLESSIARTRSDSRGYEAEDGRPASSSRCLRSS